jgi:predicted amidophosphoribosyltransferase
LEISMVSTTGLCEACHQDAALPDEDFCADCMGEIEREIERLEAAVREELEK